MLHGGSISTVSEEFAFLPYLIKKTHSRLSTVAVLESEIEDMIRCLNPNKASGPDLMSHKMLKGVTEQMCLTDRCLNVSFLINGKRQKLYLSLKRAINHQ